MVLNKSKKIFLLAVIVLVILTIGAVIAWLVISNDNQTTIQDSQTDIISEEARAELETGGCNDDNLNVVLENVEKLKGTESEEKSLQDLANCYILRKDYENAVQTYGALQDYYKSTGNEEAAISTEQVKNSIENFKTLPEETLKEAETGEPLAN